MCLAAKTPSTIAQQKAATTPKLMKTMEATNWKREGKNREGLASSLFIALMCLWLSGPNICVVFASSRPGRKRGQTCGCFTHDSWDAAGFSSPHLNPSSLFLTCHWKAYSVTQGRTLSAGWLQRKASDSTTRDGFLPESYAATFTSNYHHMLEYLWPNTSCKNHDKCNTPRPPKFIKNICTF